MTILTSVEPGFRLFAGHSPNFYSRRKTRVVPVGRVMVGGINPIRVQSMTTTSTLDVIATVEQTLRLADVKCEIVRITAPTVREAAALEKIKSTLLQRGCDVPLVADIHFRPDAAMLAAEFVEKVRINPGNYTDSKMFKVREYSDEQYDGELRRIEDAFTPLVLKLKKLGKSLRIGTNHGSLSDRIMNRFGDTPLGMVESALEYVRVCRKNNFHDIILSMKSSNPKIMIAAYRLLSQRMDQEEMDYPFHLGVTEAGDGEDGRIKSAIGIGALLEDGIGDTIRVSLTEDPEHEVPVAYDIARKYSFLSCHAAPSTPGSFVGRNESPVHTDDFVSYRRRETHAVQSGPIAVGADAPVRVISRVELSDGAAHRVLDLVETRVKKDTPPEIIEIPYGGANFVERFESFRKDLDRETLRLSYWISFRPGEFPPPSPLRADAYVVQFPPGITGAEMRRVQERCAQDGVVLVITSADVRTLTRALDEIPDTPGRLMIGVGVKDPFIFVHKARWVLANLRARGLKHPVVLFGHEESPSVITAAHMGSLLCDGMGDALRVSTVAPSQAGLDFGYNLLQASGNRITKTEYVSCPSCGRTLFDLQETTERIKSKTNHLKGVKIAIMGCIVNGPGEMADADFGYVGGGPGKINLYVGKTCVQKSIPAAVADERLIELIKSHGKWIDPPSM